MEKELNLIEQLQTTPKWKEFEEWYNKFVPTYSLGNKAWLKDINSTSGEGEVDFLELPIEFQKGVFEKFISENNTDITVDGYLGNETYGIGSTFADWKWFENFEQLLIWYFNN